VSNAVSGITEIDRPEILKWPRLHQGMTMIILHQRLVVLTVVTCSAAAAFI